MKRVRLKIIVNLNLIFIYTTTINKQVLHLILISLLVTDVSARVSLIWEEGGVPLRTHVSKGDQISVAAVRSECIVHYATWTQNMLQSNKCDLYLNRNCLLRLETSMVSMSITSMFWKPSNAYSKHTCFYKITAIPVVL